MEPSLDQLLGVWVRRDLWIGARAEAASYTVERWFYGSRSDELRVVFSSDQWFVRAALSALQSAEFPVRAFKTCEEAKAAAEAWVRRHG